EFLAWIAMLTPGPPVAPARVAALRSRPTGVGFLLRLFRRLPQPAAREVFHHRIRMLFLDALERRQQLLALGGAKCRWQAAGNDRPVDKARGHQRSAPIRLSFSTSVVRLMRSKSAALLRLPRVRSSARWMR